MKKHYLHSTSCVVVTVRWPENAADATHDAMGRETAGHQLWFYIGR